MSHGHKAPKDFGSKTSAARVEDISGIIEPGTPEHETAMRSNAANLVREIRSMRHDLTGDWTIREWNIQARQAGRRYLQNMKRYVLANRE